jgi:hypothetical protein
MPGLRFVQQNGGKVFVPKQAMGLMGYSENGASSITATGQIYAGDILVLTNAATWTAGTIPVVRQLKIADQYTSGPHYYTSDHSTGAIAGVFGVAAHSAASDASGNHQALALPYTAAYPYPFSEPGLYPADPTTGKGVISAFDASGNVFAARYNYETTMTIAALKMLPGNLAAITAITGTGSNGIPTGVMGYYVDTIGASTTPQFVGIIRCIGWNTNDPAYQATIGAATPVGWTGSATAPFPQTPEMIFEFVTTYCQTENRVPYSV